MAAVVAGRPRRIFRLAPGLLTIKGRQGENRGQRPVARPQHPPLRDLLVRRFDVVDRLIRGPGGGCLASPGNLQEISRKK
jgi:hypothetical protein